MGIYIPGIEMPTQGFVEVLIDAKGNALLTGKSVRYGNQDYYTHVTREQVFHAIPVPPHDCEAFEKVISERIAQIEKWGEESCNHPFEWMSILGEEFGEICQAVNETCFMTGKHPERGGAENIIREAAQIAAVAIAIIRDFSPTIIPADPAEEGDT